ncbi:MazG nucleotide pyrophosphohydrolase domain-containing protein [Patescibacteria group bacterium]
MDKKKTHSTPFGDYFRKLDDIDKGVKKTDEFGSFLILSLVEEIGEMARAYLAKHGRKKSNIAAQEDETYEQELGDILVAILRFARIKDINLDKRIKYSLSKIKKRKTYPKR